MANRHVKRCSTLLTIREKQIKQGMRFHLTPVRLALIKKIRNNKILMRMWRKGNLHCWWECNLEQSLRKTVWNFLKRLKIKNMIHQFHSWASIQKNKSTNSKRYMCLNIHSSTTYNSNDVEKLPECLSTAGGIKKIIYIYIYIHTHTYIYVYIYMAN